MEGKTEQIDSFTTSVKSCARCGQNHEEMQFKKLRQPMEDWTHWGLCPITSEPVILCIKVREGVEM